MIYYPMYTVYLIFFAYLFSFYLFFIYLFIILVHMCSLLAC